MEKSLNNYKVYNSVSRLEAVLLNSVEAFIVFSSSTIKRITSWKPFMINNILTSLKRKGMIVSIKKNSYCLTKNIPEHLFTIATLNTTPSYISFWTAASYYGYTEQQVKIIQTISTKQYHKLTLLQHPIETTTFQTEKFYGYQKINGILIAEKEKLLLEMLYQPEKAGGLEEVKKIMENMWPELEQKKLLEYLK